MVAQTARMFGQRPSSLMRMTDPVLALAFDLAAAERLAAADADALDPDGGQRRIVEL